MNKLDPRDVADAALSGADSGEEEVLVGEFTRELKRSLCAARPMYLDPPEIT
jgi:hypothetical protein